MAEVMIDLETLSVENNAIILSIGVVIFDLDKHTIVVLRLQHRKDVYR